MSDWFLYVLRCADNSLYTGITTDVSRRLAEHLSQGPKMAKYLRGRTPFELVFWAKAGLKAEALSLEHRFKTLPRQQKLILIANPRQWVLFTQKALTKKKPH